MGSNQDLGAYSIEMQNNDTNSLTIINDTYSSEGELTAVVIFEDDTGFVIVEIDGLQNLFTPSLDNGVWSAPITVAVPSPVTPTTPTPVNTFIYSTSNVKVNFGQFVMGTTSNILFSETFDGAFDNIWAINTLSSDFSSPGVLSWRFFEDPNVWLNFDLVASFSQPIDIDDLYINQKSYESNNAVRGLYLFGSSLSDSVAIGGEESNGVVFKATDIINGYEGSFNGTVYGIGYCWEDPIY